MTNTFSEGQVLKSDTRGRVRTPLARQEALLDEFEKSAVSGAQFAALAGVKYQTFASWVHRRRKDRGEVARRPRLGAQEPAQAVRWMEAIVENAATAPVVANGTGLMVYLPGGARMEIGDERQAAVAAELLRALASERTPPC